MARVFKSRCLDLSRSGPEIGPTFLKAHWNSIFGTDFTTVEVWTRGGLVTFYVLAVYFGAVAIIWILTSFVVVYVLRRPAPDAAPIAPRKK